MPLGAPGEIVFSGICVGRGYVNDPDRTRLAFMTDPHRKGERLYRSGDYGRWLPDGKLEFLGRTGFPGQDQWHPVNLGEVENMMLRVPGVRQAAVVVAERPTATPRSLLLRPTARERRPERPARSMAAREQDSLSLPMPRRAAADANGKIDKKALTAVAGELSTRVEPVVQEPMTPAEQRVAAAWAALLGISQDRSAGATTSSTAAAPR